MTKRILVVDDSATMRDMLTQMLRADEHIVAAANSGLQALDILQTEKYDILITDLEMPELDGFGLISAISKLKSAPAVVLISHLDNKALHSAKELAIAYSVNVLGTLTRPIDQADLEKALSGAAITRQSDTPGAEARLSETEFMRGLMTDGLSPVFQPKINIKTNKVVGVEVFARWKIATGGFLGARAVVNVALEKGYMDILTFRMLELAMQQQSKWSKEGHNIALSINVGGENLRKANFAEVVSGLADQFEIKPAMVRLEVTEADLEVDARGPLEVLSRLHMRGFGLALDDFGTGFASLLRLQKIPFDELVVDREFLSRAGEDEIAKAILETAIELTHKLKLICTCEGVENEAQLKMIADMGADNAQGYHLARPMSADEFLIWYEDYKTGAISISGL